MTDRATTWSLTINNPTPSDEEAIALARQKGWKVEGQKEKGSEGTEHYQLMVKTPQVRFSAVKKAFPRAHIEVARNVQALKQYVTKQDTRLSELPTAQDRYPSLSKLWELIYDFIHADDMSSRFLGGPHELICDTARAMIIFDEAIRNLIGQGYFVESLAVNPQVRSSWKMYYMFIFLRTHDLKQSQTDRQTDMRSEDEVSIPVIEHNHAHSSVLHRDGGGFSEEEDHSSSSGTSFGSQTEEGSDSFGEESDCS